MWRVCGCENKWIDFLQSDPKTQATLNTFWIFCTCWSCFQSQVLSQSQTPFGNLTFLFTPGQQTFVWPESQSAFSPWETALTFISSLCTLSLRASLAFAFWARLFSTGGHRATSSPQETISNNHCRTDCVQEGNRWEGDHSRPRWSNIALYSQITHIASEDPAVYDSLFQKQFNSVSVL